jgi:pyruvate, water dikinase
MVMVQSVYTLTFEECRPECMAQIGGKCSSLGRLTQAGAAVPPGLAVTTAAYAHMLAANGLDVAIAAQLATLERGDVQGEVRVSQAIRDLIETAPIPADIADAIRASYQALCERCGVAALPVAVRSSATAEDLPGASFAGQQDTYLWVVGVEAVLEHVKRCWASLFTARAIAYREEHGFGHERVQMSVAVQKMVNARVAGVAFTLNPINGDRSKIVIDASYGLGEAIASGLVTPDNYTVDKVIWEVVARRLGSKQIELVADQAARRVVERAVDEARQHAHALSDDELVAVARLARQAEKLYGCPQDVEWAIDADLPPPHNLVLLQSRPETVWSQQATRQTSNHANGTLGVLNSLLMPVQFKQGGQ